MHTRIIWTTIVVVTLVGVVLYQRWQRAGYEEMQAATERIADAVARSDHETLATEPILQHRDGTAALLLRYSPALAKGYRVTVTRNGSDGHTLMSRDIVSHLGTVHTSEGTLTLGFWYDRESRRLEFVTASFDTFP